MRLCLHRGRNIVPIFGREELAHDEKRNVGVTARVGGDKKQQTGQGKPSKRHLHFFAVNFEQVEEGTQSGQSDGHERARNEQKHTTAGFVDQKHGSDRGQELYNTYNLLFKKKGQNLSIKCNSI